MTLRFNLGWGTAARAAAALILAAMPRPAPAQTGALGDARLVQITIPSTDLTRSTAFYRDVLGLKLLFQVPGAAFFDMAGVRLRIELVKTAPATGDELYFDDPGLSRQAALAARGVKFLGPAETVQRTATSDLKLLEFLDPDGNPLALMGEVRRP
jgi:catechol 2,3-dioxygenase-like lactoylglutathione lyase family enzyme